MNVRHRIAGRVKRTPRKAEGEVVYAIDCEDTPVLDLLTWKSAGVSHFREGNHLHVSDLIGKCVRRIALSEEEGAPMPSQAITHSMGLTFAQGNAIHDYVRAVFIRQHSKVIFGSWRCVCGSLVHKGKTLSEVGNAVCDKCGTAPTTYEELVLEDEGLRLRGSPDVLLRIGRKNTCLHPVEIKSISAKEWETLSRPKPDHVVQVLFYWRLLRKAGYAVSATASILYCTKGFMFRGSPFKEFVISAADSMHLLDDYIADAKAFALYKAEGVIPRRVVCSSLNCTDAKNCHVAMACFREK